MAFAFWFIILVRMTGLADKQDGQDFYTLLLGATLGMCLMASANHLMTIFLGVEMASVPSYVLAGILKGRRRASEASLKYAVYGAGAAGVMLYGISLLAGLLGTAHLPTIAAKLAAMDIPAMIAARRSAGTLMVLVLAGLMIMVGLAFKLSAVPFHFWCPDVFEGASAEVDAFLVGRLEGGRDGAVGPRGARRDSGRGRQQRRHSVAATARSRSGSHAVSLYQQPADGATPRGCRRRRRRRSLRSAASSSCCWRSSPRSPARSATWPPTAKRTSSGCWPIRRSPTPAT